mgnify:CR=1 FL=1
MPIGFNNFSGGFSSNGISSAKGKKMMVVQPVAQDICAKEKNKKKTQMKKLI